MITATLSFAFHMIMSSYRILAPVAQIVGYVSPFRGISSVKATMEKINVNKKHLTKGDLLPPFKGKLRVYNMRYCPYAQRTILVLNAKKIDYEVVNINLMDKPEWLTSKSPLGKVPSLEIEDGVCVAESLVTAEYLDEVFPQRPLLPKDPLTRAFHKFIVEAAGPIYTMFFKQIKSPDTITEDNIRDYHSALQFIEAQLKRRGSKFLGGIEPGYSEYMIWPWFERLLEIQKYDKRSEIDPKIYKLLSEYINDMSKDPAVVQYLVPSDVFRQIFEDYRAKKYPNYDLMLEA